MRAGSRQLPVVPVRLAIQPMCHMSHKDLWQLYMLGK